MTDSPRTLYVLVDYSPDRHTTHTRGTAVQFQPGDRQADELLHRGILSTRPVRRQAGDTQQ